MYALGTSATQSSSPELSVLINRAPALARLLRKANSRSGEGSTLSNRNRSDTGSINYDAEISLYEEVEGVIRDLLRELNEGVQGQGLLVDESVAYVRDKIDEFLRKFVRADPANEASYESLIATNKKRFESLHQSSFSIASHDHELQSSAIYHLAVKNFDINEKFRKLTYQKMQCLFCFSLFPEGSVIERAVLIYWWIALGFTPDLEVSDQLLANLASEGFIQRKSVIRNKKVSNSYKMRTGIYSEVENQLVEQGLWYNKVAVLQKAGCFSVRGDSLPEAEAGKIRILFNNGKRNFDAAATKIVSFSGLKNVQVAHLGSWHGDSEDYIVVEESDFLKALGQMKEISLLSLRGISGIVELPNSVYKLESLRFLDLRACHNLELLPEGIESLHQLTHLDLSECYLLHHIPKKIVNLSKLRVLKGFIVHPDRRVSNENLEIESSCAFHDLSELQQLIKLAIRTRRMDFPTHKDLGTIDQMGRLKKLRITWVGNSAAAQTDDPGLQYFPDNLEKLELQAAPNETASRLLSLITKENNRLRKLYIIGGELENLGSEECCFNGVTQVRLRYLHSLHLDWSQCRGIFPDLIHLDIYECPHLTDFLCDENGIWKMYV